MIGVAKKDESSNKDKESTLVKKSKKANEDNGKYCNGFKNPKYLLKFYEFEIYERITEF